MVVLKILVLKYSKVKILQIFRVVKCKICCHLIFALVAYRRAIQPATTLINDFVFINLQNNFFAAHTFWQVSIKVFGPTRVWLKIVLRVNTIKGYHYRASTRLKYHISENPLEDKPQVWTLIGRSLTAQYGQIILTSLPCPCI